MLESTTVAVHEGDLFCKQCYARKFVSYSVENDRLVIDGVCVSYLRDQKVLVLDKVQEHLEWIQVNISEIDQVQK